MSENIINPENIPKFSDRLRLKMKIATLTGGEILRDMVDVFAIGISTSDSDRAWDKIHEREDIRNEIGNHRIENFIINKCLGTEDFRASLLSIIE
jgi:hypothetical protein